MEITSLIILNFMKHYVVITSLYGAVSSFFSNAFFERIAIYQYNSSLNILYILVGVVHTTEVFFIDNIRFLCCILMGTLERDVLAAGLSYAAKAECISCSMSLELLCRDLVSFSCAEFLYFMTI